MNRNMVVFSLFLIVIGLGLDLYLVTFFGLLLLIPAVLATSKPPPRPPSTQTSEPPKRIIHKSEAKPVPAPSPSAEKMMASLSAPSGTPMSFAPPLFPLPMFPSLSTMGGTPAASTGVSEVTQAQGRDELVEAGAILAILKLVFG